jgi:glutathionylspermidine synthase
VKRRAIEPRPGWRATVEAQGLVFHSTAEAGAYWAEGTYYELTAAEADAIEAAAGELHRRCLEAVDAVVRARRYAELGLDPLAIELVERSWAAREPSLYGRFDLALGPDGVPKLLEYNADTPTSLLEAAVVQWMWRASCLPDRDQASALHDLLIARWRALVPAGELVHFACVDDVEDAMTVAYLRDTAAQAGLATVGLAMTDLGWDPERGRLIDLDGRAIATLFKLYPWEGLLADPLAAALGELRCRWLEPAWKMVLSNKAILPILWELFPRHPNLLPAATTPAALGEAWVKKPRLGREGANVMIHAPGIEAATDGPYRDAGWVYQAYAPLGDHDGMHPVIGAWLVGDAPAGVGVRESAGPITSNTARFVPHVIADEPPGSRG